MKFTMEDIQWSISSGPFYYIALKNGKTVTLFKDNLNENERFALESLCELTSGNESRTTEKAPRK